MTETDAEFVADMEWLHSHDREAALPPEKLARLFALARRGAAADAEIERLRAALREVLEQADINDLDKKVLDRALAALGEPLPKHWVRREP